MESFVLPHLSFELWGEQLQQVEMAEVVDTHSCFKSLLCGSERRTHDASIANDDV